MYCNLFDSIRTTKYDYAQAEGVLFNMILSGYHPTLSVNQAVDSNLIMGLCSEHSEFLKLISLGAIRVAPFGRFGSITDYLDHNLKPVRGKDRNPYCFSSLAFLYDHNMYSDAQIQSIYDTMRHAIHENDTWIPRDLVANNLHKEILNDSLRTFRELSMVLKGNYLPTIVDRSSNLSQRIDHFISMVQAMHPHILSPAVSELQSYFCFLRQKYGIAPDGSQDTHVWQLSSRSHLLQTLDEMAGNSRNLYAESKAIINLCYNEKVAASLGDNEDDLMVTDPIFPSLYCYAQHNVRMQQAILFTSAGPGQQPSISWSELLDRYTEYGFIPSESDGLKEDPLVFRSSSTASRNSYWQIQFSREYAESFKAGQSEYPIASLKTNYTEER